MPPARWYTKTNVLSSPPGRLSSSTATLVDSALAGRVSAALSVVTELNFPLSGTMTAANATHRPITSHGTHRPANRPAGASPDRAAVPAITCLLHARCIAYLTPTSYRANLRRPLKPALRPVGRARRPAPAPAW